MDHGLKSRGLKRRGSKSRGRKVRGRIVSSDAPIVKMGVRLPRQVDERTREEISKVPLPDSVASPHSAEQVHLHKGGTPRGLVIPNSARLRKMGSPLSAGQVQQRFGERVREVRRVKGMSQETLALVVGMDRAFIGRVERGEANISLFNIYKIARGLGVPSRDLMP